MLAQNDPEGAPEESKDRKEPPKSMSKLVRVMTVLAYLSSVSMAAILLSIYYLCIWKSPVMSDLQPKVSHQRGDAFSNETGYMSNDSAPYDYTGGSSATINDNDVQLPPSSITYPTDLGSSEMTDNTTAEPTLTYNSTEYHNETTESSAASITENNTIAKTTLTI